MDTNTATMPQPPLVDQHDLPEWLQTPQQPTPMDRKPPVSAITAANLANVVYPNLFENALDRVMAGESITTIIDNDPRGIQLGRFMYWISRDPRRQQRYEDATRIAADMLSHTLIGIADATDSMEDVQRSALRIKARTYLMEKWHPRRYGDSKHVRIDQTSLSLSGEDLRRLSTEELKKMALEMAQRGAIDVTPTSSTIDDNLEAEAA